MECFKQLNANTSLCGVLCRRTPDEYFTRRKAMRALTIYPGEFPEPWASDWGEDGYGLWMGFTYKGVKQFFRWLEPGTFLMGSPQKTSRSGRPTGPVAGH